MSNNLLFTKGTNTMPANKGFFSKRRVDGNHKEIVKAVEQAGCSVLSLADKGHGCPDLLVGFRGDNYLVEVKNGAGALTDDQQRFINKWRGQVMVIRSIEEVNIFFGQTSNFLHKK